MMPLEAEVFCDIAAAAASGCPSYLLMMGLCTIVISFGAIISRASSTIAQTVGRSRAAFGPTFRIEGGAMIFSFFRPVCCFAEPICAPHFLESHFIPQVRVQVVIK